MGLTASLRAAVATLTAAMLAGKALVAAGLAGAALAAGAAASASTTAGAPAVSAVTPIAADDPLAEPRFERVGATQISRDVVASLVQDRAGFLWIATGDGLVRYDGYRFRPVERDHDDPAARNLGWIRALLAGRDGRVWIGTEADGLVVYDPASDRVSDLRPQPAARSPRPTVRALAEAPDGAIWIGTLGGGLERFDPASGRFESWRQGPRPGAGAGADPGALPDDRVLALQADADGTLWVGTWVGLARRMPGSDRFEPVFSSGRSADGGTDLQGRAVQALHRDRAGRLWVGTAQGDLALIDPASGSGRFLWTASLAAPRAPGAVAAFAETADGRLWVGRASGLDVHDSATGRLLNRLRHDARRPAGLAANEVTALVLDRAGWLWVGGLGLGLQRHHPAGTTLRVRGADPEPGNPFEDPSARSLLALDSGELWLASAAGGLVIMDQHLRVVGAVGLSNGDAAPRALRLLSAAGRTLVRASGWDDGRVDPAEDEAPPEPRAEALTQAADGSVWVATPQALHQFSRERRWQRSLRHAGSTHRLFASLDGSVWVCAHDGLYRLRPGAAALERVPRAGGAPFVGDAFAMAEAADGRLWVGTVSGLYRIEPGTFELAPVASPEGEGLGSAIVIGLLVDRQQRLWLDTAVAGLHRLIDWDGRQARFERVSLRHGVVGRPFGVNLLDDDLGRIWTQQHVYDPQADRIDELTAADGKDIGTGWFHAYARLRDGRMAFAGSKGLLVVEPQHFRASDYAPTLVVAELRVNGRRQPSPPSLQQLELQPDDRSFGVVFAALDLSDPARLRYAVQLEGFDGEWLPVSAEDRSATYSNLRPGDYRLRVRATNRSGVWSPNELAIAVRVHPPWWREPWAVAAAVLLALAALQALVRLRTRQLRARQRELEASVQERTAELQRLTKALQQESAALKESSLTDPLTGLRNRRFLVMQAADETSLAARRHEDAASSLGEAGAGPAPADADLVFFVIDLDHFKRINDEHGHAAGDAVLRGVAERLGEVFRESDHLVRWGGEEFLAMARGTSREHADALAERIRSAVAAQPFAVPGGSPLRVTCSIGFACFPLSCRHPRLLDWGETVNLADAALYAAKASGRDAWVGLVDAGEIGDAAAGARRSTSDWLADPRVRIVRSRPARGRSSVG